MSRERIQIPSEAVAKSSELVKKHIDIFGVCDFQMPPAASISSPVEISNKCIISRSGDLPPGFHTPGLSPPSYVYGHHSGRSFDKRVILYKTEMCRTFEETGLCKYEEKCQFAHSREELRPANKHPRYKTEICKTFWDQGTCPYGKRCCFIHNENPAGLKMNTCNPRNAANTGPINLRGAHPVSFSSSLNSESRLLPIISKFSTSPLLEHSSSWDDRRHNHIEEIDISFERAPGSRFIVSPSVNVCKSDDGECREDDLEFLKIDSPVIHLGLMDL